MRKKARWHMRRRSSCSGRTNCRAAAKQVSGLLLHLSSTAYCGHLSESTQKCANLPSIACALMPACVVGSQRALSAWHRVTQFVCAVCGKVARGRDLQELRCIIGHECNSSTTTIVTGTHFDYESNRKTIENEELEWKWNAAVLGMQLLPWHA